MGTGGDLHTKVLEKMRDILQSEELYSYLQPNAVQRLEKARRLAHESGLLNKIVDIFGVICRKSVFSDILILEVL